MADELPKGGKELPLLNLKPPELPTDTPKLVFGGGELTAVVLKVFDVKTLLGPEVPKLGVLVMETEVVEIEGIADEVNDELVVVGFELTLFAFPPNANDGVILSIFDPKGLELKLGPSVLPEGAAIEVLGDAVKVEVSDPL